MSTVQALIDRAYDISLGLVEISRTESPETLFSRVVLQRSRALRDELDAALAALLASPSLQTEEKEEGTRMDTMGDSTDSRTAAINETKSATAPLLIDQIRQRLDQRRNPPPHKGICDACGQQQPVCANPNMAMASGMAAEQWVCQKCYGQITVTMMFGGGGPSADDDIEALLAILAERERRS